ncbi:MAG: transcription antitermination factor NusB [candidate division WOR-3 bacterium]
MGRRLARELALKILYCYECGGGDITEIMKAILSKKKYQNGVKDFCRELVSKTINNLTSIDQTIAQVLKNWRYERVSLIDKLVLRIGTCEICYFDDIPYEATINEAIEIGKKYGTEDSGKFINGVLDAIGKESQKKRKDESSNNQ